MLAMPMLQRPRLREHAGLPCRPMRCRTPQIHPQRRSVTGGAIHQKPCLPLAHAQESTPFRRVPELSARPSREPARHFHQRGAIRIEHDNPRRRPKRRQCRRVITQRIGAIQCALDERERAAPSVHTVNDEPQPQVVLAFGLRMTNCAPDSDST